MKTARIIWPPWPYSAGFCITDDTDAADLRSVQLVYNLLSSLGLLSTKTVWPFRPIEPSGIPATPPSTLRGVTLEEKEYMDYCMALAEKGHEIALHGASAGNNRREKTIAAFDIIEGAFGNDGTYICHSKNAENIYWEAKVAPSRPLRRILSLYTRHHSLGDEEGSPYFWGDVCHEKVKWIRLFRTRETNTLKVNPSMPYREAGKPFVRGWFSATKRSFHDCTAKPALDRICAEHGLTILYQYMHRYADLEHDCVDQTFVADAERLASDPRILVHTTAHMMERLRLVQGIFCASKGSDLYLFNTGPLHADELQITVPDEVEILGVLHGIERKRSVLRVKDLPAADYVRIPLNMEVRVEGDRWTRLDACGRGRIVLDTGQQLINLAEHAWQTENGLIPARSFLFASGATGDASLSCPGAIELHRLFFAQAGVIAREMACGNRQLTTEQYLRNGLRPLEDHRLW